MQSSQGAPPRRTPSQPHKADGEQVRSHQRRAGRASKGAKPMTLSDAIALIALVLAAIRLGLDIPRKK